MKKYKPKYKTKYPPERRSDADWERTAIQYAQWLAAKREITLPQGKAVKVSWSGINSKYATGRNYYERRIQAVEWGHYVRVYNTRKNGQQGAYLYTKWVCTFSIELPHWDWVPKVIDLTDVLDLDPAWEVLPLAA